MPPPVWVARPEALQSLLNDLASQPRLAVDTESNSLHAYREQVCLIQFSTPQTDYLLDPLALPDLSPLAPIFANPRIEKVFHAVEYDLICLKRDFGFDTVNIFDTMQAARLLGYKQVGLDAVLLAKLGVKVNKRYQKADWAERPLSPEMLNYARLDTHYLLEVRDLLQAELEARGRWELAREEFARLAHGNGNHKLELQAWQRINGCQKLTDQQLAVLKELCDWRERQAQRMDRPTFKVLDDKRLAILAASSPKTLDDLEVLGLTPRQTRLYGRDLLHAITRGQKAPAISRARSVRPSQAFLNRLDSLNEWRKDAGRKMGVESDLVLPKAWMNAIAEKNPKDLQELSLMMPGSPWRMAQFGTAILEAIASGGARQRKR